MTKQDRYDELTATLHARKEKRHGANREVTTAEEIYDRPDERWLVIKVVTMTFTDGRKARTTRVNFYTSVHRGSLCYLAYDSANDSMPSLVTLLPPLVDGVNQEEVAGLTRHAINGAFNVVNRVLRAKSERLAGVRR